MPAFRVDLNHLDQITGRLAGLVDYIETELAKLDQTAESIDNWTGEAATAFATAHRAWTTGAKDLKDGIAAMQRAALQAHQSYSAAVSTNLTNLGRA